MLEIKDLYVYIKSPWAMGAPIGVPLTDQPGAPAPPPISW